MKIILNTIISLIVVLLVLSLWGFYNAIRPFKIVSTVTPKDFGIKYESVSFKTKDNVLIRGWFIPHPNPKAKTIVLLHGYPADKGNILPSTIFLHKSYNLLYFDFRYLGGSEGYYSTVGKNEVLDLLAAIQFLHSRGINEVGMWGFSLGGAVALMTAPLAPQIKAIVSESSYARLDLMTYEYYKIPLLKYPLGELTRLWGWLFLHDDIKKISPATAAEKINIPILLIHSKRDQVISYDHALLLQKSLKHNPKAQFLMIENTTHGEHFENYEKVIERFFADNL